MTNNGRRRVVAPKRVVTLMAVCYVVIVAFSVSQIALLTHLLPGGELLEHQQEWMKSTFSFSSVQKHDKKTKRLQEASQDEIKPTLALLYPPGMIGGFRNQVIRFVALVHHAQSLNISQLLLPTILWSTQYEASGTFYPVPMEYLFDIDHWNSFSTTWDKSSTSEERPLPKLVSSLRNGDCWEQHEISPTNENGTTKNQNTTTSAIFQFPLATRIFQESSPFLKPLYNISRELALGKLPRPKIRKLDLSPEVQHCRHPYVYGGGTGAGVLWNDYLTLPKVQPGQPAASASKEANQTMALISQISRALIPSKRWRTVADQCILQTSCSHKLEEVGGYVALHARVEVDMMIHKCGREMEKNLTKIFDYVDTFVKEFPTPLRQGVFVAVSRTGMLETTKNSAVNATAHENWNILKQRSISMLESSQSSSSKKLVPIFECGEFWMDRWYGQQPEEPSYGSILPSMLNFYVATRADAFIGVAKSSWSTDVWTNRFYNGKGSSNYEYTPTGIRPLPNGGLPPPHKNC